MGWKPEVGEHVIVTKEHQSLQVGIVLKVTRPDSGNGWWTATVVDPNGTNWAIAQNANFQLANVCAATRSERARLLETQATKLEGEANDKMVVVVRLRSEAKRLKAFETDEEELADLLISVQDSKGPRSERVKKLAEILKGRIKTSQL